MSCKKYELTASAYLDRELSELEAAEYQAHLAGCAACRAHLGETEQVSLALRTSSQPEVPRELHSYIMTAVGGRAAGEIAPAQLVVEWMMRLNPRLLSYAAGLAVSAILFALTLSGFRPIPIEDSTARVLDYDQVEETPIGSIQGSDREYHIYNKQPLPRGQESASHEYDLPRVMAGDNSPLVLFSRMASPGPSGMSAMVEIATDGTARLVRVRNEPDDPPTKDARGGIPSVSIGKGYGIIERLVWSLNKPGAFQPAMVEGKPAATNIILLVEEMDISG